MVTRNLKTEHVSGFPGLSREVVRGTQMKVSKRGYTNRPCFQ